MKTATKRHAKPERFGPTRYVRLKEGTEVELRNFAARRTLPLATAIRWAVEEGLPVLRRKAS